jgi:nanoRNase/pAp phosphatase (c-di-AMP/oligoRNAs hydrolase)
VPQFVGGGHAAASGVVLPSDDGDTELVGEQ